MTTLEWQDFLHNLTDKDLETLSFAVWAEEMERDGEREIYARQRKLHETKEII